MAETRDWSGNGRALGWLFALVVLAAVIWGLVELLTDSDAAEAEASEVSPPAGEVRMDAPSPAELSIRIA